MKTKRIFTIVILLIVIIVSWISRYYQNKPYSGEFFGQEKPAMQPLLFAEHFISDGMNNRDSVFSPNADEFYTTCWMSRLGTILFSKKENQDWSDLQVAPFSGVYSDLEPFVTADGNFVYFISDRPLSASDSSSDYNIWFVQRQDTAWSSPQPLGPTINTDANEFYPSLSKNGTLYWTAHYDNTLGGEDIWCSKNVNGVFQPRQNLGKAVNSAFDEFNAFVSPNEEYVIFSSWGRKDDFGRGDLYVSFQQKDGSWAQSINMGEMINSDKLDYCPFVTSNGKYFFFTSKRTQSSLPATRKYEDLVALHNSSGNGSDDIYWVDAAVISKLKEAAK